MDSFPQVRAGSGEPAQYVDGQWRILPRAPFARPADPEITGRITRQIDRLAAAYRPDGSNRPNERLGDFLIDERVRIQLFRLEALLRLYVRVFPDLEKYRLSVKNVEDGLGAYTFAVDSVAFAKDKFKDENRAKPPDAARTAEQDKTLQGLEQKHAAARAAFTKLVERSTMEADLPELRSMVLSTFAGWSPSEDIGFVTGELLRVLKKVRHDRFNFNLLEDGIHEFRRQLRWFPVLIDSLDGLILVREDPPGACPVPTLESLAGSRAARHRYANPELAYPATRPCNISRCLLWQVVKTVDEMGRLKDDIQGEASVSTALDDEYDVPSSNFVTPQEIARAQSMRTELFSSRAIESLMTQLSSCKP